MATRTLVVVAALVALTSTLSGCLSPQPLIVALSAPKASDGMTVFVVTDPSLTQKLAGAHGTAEYAVYYGDRLVYPPGGRGATFPVEGHAGSVFVPYKFFVVGNGDYRVVVNFAGRTTVADVTVEKWVDYVFLHPFDRGDTILVEAALASSTGGHPEDLVLSSGELVLNMHYHGLNGEEDRTVGSVSTTTQHDKTSTNVPVPRSRFTQGPGYYSFEPTFHNLEATNNVQVPGDPTMANRDPPWNWVYIGP